MSPPDIGIAALSSNMASEILTTTIPGPVRSSTKKGYRTYVHGRLRHLIQCAGVKCFKVKSSYKSSKMWTPLWALVVVDWVALRYGGFAVLQSGIWGRRWPKGFWRECVSELRRLNEDMDARYALMAELILRYGNAKYLGLAASKALEEGLP